MALKGKNKILKEMHDYQKCQIFTPTQTGEKMLALCEYSKDPLGHSFLECSCGDGALLCLAIKHYIEAAIEQGMEISRIKRGLEESFVGIEIEETKAQECAANLAKEATKYGITDVKWNIIRGDFLSHDFENKRFDFIVGNPPYVSYLNMSEKLRQELRNNYESCQFGKFDYCFPFIERGMNLLSPGGKLCFITPKAILKTEAGKKIREMMLPDITTVDLSLPNNTFPDILVAPVVFVIKAKSQSTSLKLVQSEGKTSLIDKNLFKGSRKWDFGQNEKNSTKKTTYRFGDCYEVFASIATLANPVFILTNGKLGSQYFETEDGDRIEAEIIRKAILPRLSRNNKEAFLVFPYRRDGERIPEKTFRKLYPCAMAYFERHKDELLDRDADNKAAFYEFGRYQSIRKMSGDKYCLSQIVTKSPSLWYCDDDTVPCSGIIIKEKNKGFPLSNVPAILSDKTFLRYVERNGIQSAGSSVRITVQDVREFRFATNE